MSETSPKLLLTDNKSLPVDPGPYPGLSASDSDKRRWGATQLRGGVGWYCQREPEIAKSIAQIIADAAGTTIEVHQIRRAVDQIMFGLFGVGHRLEPRPQAKVFDDFTARIAGHAIPEAWVRQDLGLPQPVDSEPVTLRKAVTAIHKAVDFPQPSGIELEWRPTYGYPGPGKFCPHGIESSAMSMCHQCNPPNPQFVFGGPDNPWNKLCQCNFVDGDIKPVVTVSALTYSNGSTRPRLAFVRKCIKCNGLSHADVGVLAMQKESLEYKFGDNGVVFFRENEYRRVDPTAKATLMSKPTGDSDDDGESEQIPPPKGVPATGNFFPFGYAFGVPQSAIPSTMNTDTADKDTGVDCNDADAKPPEEPKIKWREFL